MLETEDLNLRKSRHQVNNSNLKNHGFKSQSGFWLGSSPGMCVQVLVWVLARFKSEAFLVSTHDLNMTLQRHLGLERKKEHQNRALSPGGYIPTERLDQRQNQKMNSVPWSTGTVKRHGEGQTFILANMTKPTIKEGNERHSLKPQLP